MSLAVLNRCRGKRSITLDLKRPGATQVFADLVRHADIVVENFSSGTADRLGVGYAVARAAANPAVIYCSISGFGADTNSGVRAMDTIIQALSGVMLTSGAPGEPPVRVGVPMADVLTPVWAVAGILAALHRRTVRNVGEHVDVSMLGTLTSLVATEDWAAMDQLGQETAHRQHPAQARPVRHLPLRGRLGRRSWHRRTSWSPTCSPSWAAMTC